MFISDIPLTQSLKILKKNNETLIGAREKRFNDDYQTRVHFQMKVVEDFYKGQVTFCEENQSTGGIGNLFRQYRESIEAGELPQLVVDSAYLFDTLSYGVFVDINPTKTGTFKIKYLPKGAFRALLLGYTSWFPSLKYEIQEKVLNLREKHKRRDRKTNQIIQEFGCAKLRRVLEATDMIVVGFFLGGESNESICRIQKSILSNLVSDGETGYWSFIKLWKTFIKKVRKALFMRADFKAFFSEEENLPRRLTWVKSTEFYHRLLLVNQGPEYPYTWETLEPICIVLQTRSTGLANGIAEADSIDKFLSIVTNKDDDYDYKWISKGGLDLKCKPFDSGVLSLTSSACVESSRQDGGKFEIIKSIIKSIYDQGGICLLNYETGEFSTQRTLPPKPTCDGWEWPEYLSEEIGHYLFSWAVNQYRNGDHSWSTLHLSTVIEQGKARVVTPGSILMFLLTMPMSHSTLRMMEQLPEIRVGVSDTDDGWQFWKRMGPSDKSEDYKETDKKYKDCFFCADLETATDYAPWGLVHTTLEIIKSLGYPKWYVNMVDTLLTSPRKIIVDGSHLATTTRGAMMADPVTKTVLTLSHYCILKAVLKEVGIANAPFAIKGDDVIVKLPFEKSSGFEQTYRKAMNLSGFKLSEDDTYLSRTYGFYCESIFRLYSETRESPTSFNQMVDKRDPSFCDVPTVKLSLPTWRDNRRIGEVPEGKISLLSKRGGWMDPKSLQYFQYELLNVIQWYTFRMEDRDPVFLYGPTWRGGLNKRPPFGDFSKVKLSDQQRRRLVLDFSYIITKVVASGKYRLLSEEQLNIVEDATNPFILRNSNDEYSDLVTMDFDIPSEPIWTSKDEQFWNIGLGERLKQIKGITTDRSIKSKMVTVLNLSNREVPTKPLDPVSQVAYQELIGTMSPNDLQNLYNIYVKKVGNRDYGYTNWSLHLEDQFPLYNCMKVNPSDRTNNSIRQVYSTIKQSIRSRTDWVETRKGLEEEFGLSIGDLESIREAIVLHKSNAKELLVNQEQYELLEFKEIDCDSRAHLELRSMYSKIKEWFHKLDWLRTLNQFRENNDKDRISQLLGPKRVLVWASRDVARLAALRRESKKIWDSLNIPPSMFRYTFINVLHYIPNGLQTEWGFMLENLEYKSGFIKYIDPGKYLDPYDPNDLCRIVVDTANTESTAQELLSRGLTDSREVGYANRTIPMGYSMTNVVGVLTS